MAKGKSIKSVLAEPLAPTDGTSPAEPLAPTDGISPAELLALADGTSPAESLASTDGTSPAEPLASVDGISSAELLAPAGVTSSAEPLASSQEAVPEISYRITAANNMTKQIGGIKFINGVGFGKDGFSASWFENKGYKVEKVVDDNDCQRGGSN